ncbi:hypothetical protein MPSEU_000695300 [Mayamaea pseudoterrestris]|nr:hypothetical protein MPSEU_000695300 [Mayamaea pseudoterrestris]
MGASASTIATVVSTHREINQSIDDFNGAVEKHERNIFDGYCPEVIAKAQRKKQLEETYREKLRVRQERKSKILEQFIYNQRQQTNPVIEAIMGRAAESQCRSSTKQSKESDRHVICSMDSTMAARSVQSLFRLLICLLVASTLDCIAKALALHQTITMGLSQPQNQRPTDVVSSPIALPKTIFAIRHGLSTANEYMRKPGNQWGDPDFNDKTDIDAPLSEVGRRQARLLLNNKELFESVDLVLVSPLRRCLQTYLEGVQPVCAKKAIVLPLLRERVYTQSDTSSFSLQELSRQHPSLDFSEVLIHENEPWHYTPSALDGEYEEWRPNDAQQTYAVPGEPEHIFERRMNELGHWLQQRPETRILIVSHWGVIRHFTNKEAGNCQVVHFQLEAGSENAKPKL